MGGAEGTSVVGRGVLRGLVLWEDAEVTSVVGGVLRGLVLWGGAEGTSVVGGC